jgi:hypothetical protein
MGQPISRGFQILSGASIGVMIGNSYAGTSGVPEDVWQHFLITAMLAGLLINNLVTENASSGSRSEWATSVVPWLVGLSGAGLLYIGNFSANDKLVAITVFSILLLWYFAARFPKKISS